MSPPPIPVDAGLHAGLPALGRLPVDHFGDWDTFVAASLDYGCWVLGLSTGIVSRIQGNDYEVLDRHSPLGGIKPGNHYPLDDTLCAAVVTLRCTVTHPGTDTIGQVCSHPVYRELQPRAYAGTPILVDGAVYGTLSFSDTLVREAPFAAYEIGLLESIAAFIGRYIERQHAESSSTTAAVRTQASEVVPYGEFAHRLLGPVQDFVRERAEPVVNAFYATVGERASSAPFLAAINTDEFVRLKEKQTEHLLMLLDPGLTESAHHAASLRAGRIHAMAGVEDAWFAESIEILRALLDIELASALRVDRRIQLLVHRRLALDSQWQIEGSRAIQMERDAVLGRISTLAWNAERYLDLVQGVVDAMVTLEEVAACAFGRPDSSGRFQFEVAAGDSIVHYLRSPAGSGVPEIRIEKDRAEGRGPGGRAWRSGEIQRSLDYATDPDMKVWLQISRSLGIRSSVAIPLRSAQGLPESLLTIYSALPGGFSSAGQRAFLSHLQSIFGLALAHRASQSGAAGVVSFISRDRWRAKLATDDLVMYYQPVIDLRQGRAVEVEVLARIRENNGLILPAQFLPALQEDDFLILYRQALAQALTARETWVARGLPLGIAVNIPSCALLNRRYVDITREALARHPCPRSSLVLEVLESEWLEESLDAEHGLQALKELGVQLAEDDLGSGYSTLSRLRHLDFDRVKIDQTLVSKIARQPLKTLRFMNQLTRLGHDLGVKVVVEGLETPGLVEAAMILGADLGQGYAVAHPMPLADVADWCDDFDIPFGRTAQRTALGALADFILRDEWLRMFKDDAAMVEQIVDTPCRVRSYLEVIGAEGALLDRIYRKVQQAAIRQGPASSAYAAARDAFVQCLIEERIRVEETG